MSTPYELSMPSEKRAHYRESQLAKREELCGILDLLYNHEDDVVLVRKTLSESVDKKFAAIEDKALRFGGELYDRAISYRAELWEAKLDTTTNEGWVFTYDLYRRYVASLQTIVQACDRATATNTPQ